MLQLQTFWKINPEAVPQVHDVQVSELIALRKNMIKNHHHHAFATPIIINIVQANELTALEKRRFKLFG